MIFTCYDLLNDTIVLYFFTLVSFYYLFRVDDLVFVGDGEFMGSGMGFYYPFAICALNMV